MGISAWVGGNAGLRQTGRPPGEGCEAAQAPRVVQGGKKRHKRDHDAAEEMVGELDEPHACLNTVSRMRPRILPTPLSTHLITTVTCTRLASTCRSQVQSLVGLYTTKLAVFG